MTLNLLLTFPYRKRQAHMILMIQFSSVQSLSCVQCFVIPWIAVCQASLSITNSRSSPKPMSIESVMPSNHLILYCPLLLLPSIFPSIMVFSYESALHIRWPKYWSFSFNISPSNEHPGQISLGWTGWISLQSKGLFFFLIFIFTLFCFTILCWFCHTLTRISHGCTWVPNPEPPSHLLPHTISLGQPSAPVPSILYPALNLDWRFISYMILYMFQCHSPKSSHPLPLPQGPKSVLYICVSFAVSHTGLLLPSF